MRQRALPCSAPEVLGWRRWGLSAAQCLAGVVLLVTPWLSSCVNRRFGPDTAEQGATSSTTTYGLRLHPEVWQQATVIKVLAAETFVVSVAGEPGARTLSLFGVRASLHLSAGAARERTLDRVMPGQVFAVEVLARSDTGRSYGRLKDAQGDVALWLVEKGIVLPFLVCRSVDQCTPELLESLQVDAMARACELGLREAPGVSREFPADVLQREQIMWVGNVLDHTFVSVWRRAEMPVCSRVYFVAGSEGHGALTHRALGDLGFTPRASTTGAELRKDGPQ